MTLDQQASETNAQPIFPGADPRQNLQETTPAPQPTPVAQATQPQQATAQAAPSQTDQLEQPASQGMPQVTNPAQPQALNQSAPTYQAYPQALANQASQPQSFAAQPGFAPQGMPYQNSPTTGFAQTPSTPPANAYNGPVAQAQPAPYPQQMPQANYQQAGSPLYYQQAPANYQGVPHQVAAPKKTSAPLVLGILAIIFLLTIVLMFPGMILAIIGLSIAVSKHKKPFDFTSEILLNSIALATPIIIIVFNIINGIIQASFY